MYRPIKNDRQADDKDAEKARQMIRPLKAVKI